MLNHFTKRKKYFILGIVFVLLTMHIPVKANAAYIQKNTFKVKGHTYIFITKSNYPKPYSAKLYQLSNGKRKLKASKSYREPFYLQYAGNYKNKIYFNRNSAGGDGVEVYTIGKKGFRKETGKVKGLAAIKGKYALGYTFLPNDASARNICIYNLSTKKVTPLAEYVYSPTLIKGKFYYAKMNTNDFFKMDKTQIIRCNPNGCNKKVMKSIALDYPFSVTNWSVKSSFS